MFLLRPCSTLFPYTTLFRSRRGVHLGRRVVDLPLRHHGQDRTGHRWQRWWRWRRLDRKSTRLNSSHANISYAVFCLKKKAATAKAFAAAGAEVALLDIDESA